MTQRAGRITPTCSITMATPVIYKMTCGVCGLAYIGFSSRYRGRKKQHRKLSQRIRPKQLVHQHIRLHGWENMLWEILHRGGDAKEVLNIIEPKMIIDHGTLYPRGLNMVGGGGNWKRRTRRKKTNRFPRIASSRAKRKKPPPTNPK